MRSTAIYWGLPSLLYSTWSCFIIESDLRLKTTSNWTEEESAPGFLLFYKPFLCKRSFENSEMAKFLSQDQINEFKECFSLYDKKQQGKINASDLITVMRCLGTSPTPGEVERHLQGHKIDRKAQLDFSTFLTIMYRQMQQEDPEKEILAALAMTDKQKKGFITASELRAKLTRLGEKLSEEEVDDLLREAKIAPNGMVKYEEFIHTITLPVADY
ncbi:calmodulin-like protein 4 isoform 1-T1 [Pangshura tecta]